MGSWLSHKHGGEVNLEINSLWFTFIGAKSWTILSLKSWTVCLILYMNPVIDEKIFVVIPDPTSLPFTIDGSIFNVHIQLKSFVVVFTKVVFYCITGCSIVELNLTIFRIWIKESIMLFASYLTSIIVTKNIVLSMIESLRIDTRAFLPGLFIFLLLSLIT